ACLSLFACSVDPVEADGGDHRANPCATPGATYLQTFTTVSGGCGDIPSGIVNIGNDGTVPGSNGVVCERVEQDGCRAHDTNCRSSSNGCMLNETFDVSFASDGSSATGLISVQINCNDGSACSGTYRVSMTRQ